MKNTIRTKEDFIVTSWSGGETTQLAIYPEHASLSKRDFLWRISSATFCYLDNSINRFILLSINYKII